MPKLKRLPALAVALACLMLSACAGQRLEDPDLLNRAVLKTKSSDNFLNAAPERVSAAIRPESMALVPSMKGDMALMAVYRNYDDGSTRFALSMPQGTRMGSATREAGKQAKFQSLSSYSVIVDIVRASFAAIDEFFASALRDGDRFYLQNGDVRAGIGHGQTVLVRYRSLGWGSSAKFIYDLSGRPLAFYQVSGQKLDWKLVFNEGGKEDAYMFQEHRYDWIIHVELLEVTP